ncbi:MAG: cation:dicarboxylase symporter family transporter [Puniceicoccales bacterium]|jgi:Na+/H+-dicarboxylate symporter|nr:cation:dicarboxylase symporter family transporter [Puniceicoccales bacterium]
MHKKIPLALVALVFLAFVCSRILPLSLLRVFLAISVTLKSLIIFALPVLIFGMLFSTFHKLGENASKIFAIAVILLCCSNFLATYVSHFIGEIVYAMDLSLVKISVAGELLPAFDLQLPKIVPNVFAMGLGITCGIFIPRINPQYAQRLSSIVDRVVSRILRDISMIVPFFLFGFLVKMWCDGIVILLMRQYASIVATMVGAIAVYLFLFYFFACGMSARRACPAIKNMFPAAVCAFGSMSSASALPYTIAAVGKNTKNKSLAKSIVSITTNIHLLGDCIFIPILVYAILKSYGFPRPSQLAYLIFALQFVVAKFSVAAVPAGGIIVMLPIIERVFGFDGAMSSLIFSLYVVMDPICTAANVMGNGAFAQLIDRVASALAKNKHSEMKPNLRRN